jgi:uncharacterized membrane-anchored protein YhcB (DUF1043 family)
MFEYIITFIAGLLVGFLLMSIDCYRHKVKRRVELEKEYVELNKHVSRASACIESIINGSKP